MNPPRWLRAVWVVLALGAGASPLAAQDTTITVKTDTSARSDSSALALPPDSFAITVPTVLSAAQLDSLRESLRPVSPMGAFWRSPSYRVGARRSSIASSPARCSLRSTAWRWG